jgi:hypothetical protein
MVITALTHLPQNAGHARFSADRAHKQPLALAGMTSAAQATQDLGEPGLRTAWTAEHTLRQTLSSCAAQSLATTVSFVCAQAGQVSRYFLLAIVRRRRNPTNPPAVTLRLEVHS